MRPPKGWCEQTSLITLSTVSSPITIPSCDTIDESNVPPFLRDDIDLTESMDDRNYTGKCRNIHDVICTHVSLEKYNYFFFFQCHCINTLILISTLIIKAIGSNGVI